MRNPEKTRLLSLTTEEKVDQANDQSNRATRLAVAALVIALLGGIAGIVVGAVIGARNDNRINSLRADLDLLWSETQSALDQERNVTDSQLQGNLTVQYNLLHNQILLLQANAFDAIMNVSGGGGGSPYTRTNVQNGTFNWKNAFETVSISSNYSLDLVTIGPLNFQLLTLNPPSSPFVMDTGLGGFIFSLKNFNPTVSQLVRPPQDVNVLSVVSFPLTSANVGKIGVSNDGGCFSNYFGVSPPAPAAIPPYCFEVGPFSNDYTSTTIHSLLLGSDNLSLGREYFLTGKIAYNPIDYLDGHIFTLSSPWELVMDAF
jgi:hypothetical protein